ncbi:MAG: hypothetical protein AB1657_02070 [Candidatus Micrarchaeota archaeon]
MAGGKNLRTIWLWKMNSKKTKRKRKTEKPSFADVVTGNREPETGSKINEFGPAEI